jgi:hypothetical protein
MTCSWPSNARRMRADGGNARRGEDGDAIGHAWTGSEARDAAPHQVVVLVLDVALPLDVGILAEVFHL